jgi:hypothetical protein
VGTGVWLDAIKPPVFSSERRRIPRVMARTAFWPERWNFTRVMVRTAFWSARWKFTRVMVRIAFHQRDGSILEKWRGFLYATRIRIRETEDYFCRQPIDHQNYDQINGRLLDARSHSAFFKGPLLYLSVSVMLLATLYTHLYVHKHLRV